MPIQYRCRCGQEVVLRPREGVYLVVGLLLVVSILNTAMVVLLWIRLGEPRAAIVAPAHERVDAGVTSDRRAVDPGDDPRSGTVRGDPRMPSVTSMSDRDARGRLPAADSPTSDSHESSDVTPPEGVATALVASPSHRADAASTAPEPSVASEVSTGPEAAVEVVVPSSSAALRIPRPDAVSGLTLSLALESLPVDPHDRAGVLMAAAWWGSGVLRSRAEEAMRDAPGEWGAFARSWWREFASHPRSADAGPELVIPGADRVAGTDPGLGRHPGLREERFQTIWAELEARASAVRRTWTERAREALPERADFVVLIDLTESMEDAIADAVRSLSVIVPLTESGSRRRWGWIAYRDEVVDSLPPTADLDAFLRSLPRWRC
ncbi:MAG: hypothetical protein KDC38_20235, partial [Planctomycetes bacterium]|nr:hypothetical protein [Planctomycetota bacterium]